MASRLHRRICQQSLIQNKIKAKSKKDFFPMISKCKTVLEKYFNIIEIFNLNVYSRSMSSLYEKLVQIKKTEFSHNDRIIFTLFDHDFYLDYKIPGWTLYNLQLILDKLDISNYFCLLLTNQPDYNDCTRYVQQHLTSDDFPIRTITTMLFHDWIPNDKLSKTPPEYDLIEKRYCVLSRQARSHRTFFMSKLHHENLLDSGLIGYNNIHHPVIESKNNAWHPSDGINISFLEIPFWYQNLVLKNPKNREIFQKFDTNFPSYKNFIEDANVLDKSFCICFSSNIPPIKKAFLYVALETEVLIPKLHSSTITLRGILEQRPFLLFSAPYALAFLKDRGFKTFGDFWDESYDNVIDMESRVDKIIKIVKDISEMPKNQLLQLQHDVKPIIQYNYEFYHDNFVEKEQQRLAQQCEKNLNGDTN